MSIIDKRVRRDVVPRWRLSTSPQADLDSLPRNPVEKKIEVGFERTAEDVLREFDENPKPMVAAEALSVALTERSNQAAQEAAKRLAQFDLSAKPALSSLVERLLRRSQEGATVAHAEEVECSGSSARSLIRTYKRAVRIYPKNALAWLDLAFTYASVGQTDKAAVAVNTANALEKDHRKIVRSCSRFYLHSGDLDKALWTISRSNRLKDDPWLLSAHIATARASGTSSRYLSLGRKLFKEKRWRSDQISELGAAIATTEMENGSVKLAKRFVEKSLVQPTENAVAQVGWLEQMGDTDFKASEVASVMPAAWEARTFEEYERQNWRRSCEEAAQWLADQPFSSRPAVHGSYVAATFLEDYELALQFSEAGFRANPGDETVVNNYAVSLAEVGRVVDARSIYDTYMRNFIDDDLPTARATEGLILYREGRIEDARLAYLEAAENFNSRQDFRRKFIAAVYQAREELRVGEIDHARDLLQPLLVELKSKRESRKTDFESLAERVVETLDIHM